MLLILLTAALLSVFFLSSRWKSHFFPPVIFEKKLTQITDVPAGAQVLIFPVKNALITAGFRNPTYVQKNKFEHYGTDFYWGDGLSDVIASGTGEVLGTEFCENSVGNIVVIRYDHVYNPSTKEVVSLIARHYHMQQILVKEKDIVLPGQKIGVIDGGHEWYNHVHLELDTDLQYPFHTPQVAEASSELLHRYPASGEGTLEPMSVLAAGEGQRIAIHPGSDCCEPKDEPQFQK